MIDLHSKKPTDWSQHRDIEYSRYLVLDFNNQCGRVPGDGAIIYVDGEQR
jgi:hypothetical protein